MNNRNNERNPEIMRAALIQAAMEAYEDAGIRGLCAEGRWECALEAMRNLDVNSISQRDPGEHQ